MFNDWLRCVGGLNIIDLFYAEVPTGKAVIVQFP